MMFIPKKIFASSSVLIADGGDTRFGPNFAYHTFTEDGTFITDRALTADILVVAGGGGGGHWGGGGGAGGLIYNTNISLVAGSYSVTIGSGGARAVQIRNHAHPVLNYQGSNGGNSTFGSLYTAIGGGGGGSHNTGSSYSWNSNPSGRSRDEGRSGGSGGGSGFNWNISSLGGCQRPSAGAGTAGQGNNGGRSCTGGNCDNPRRAGGGGGAGGVGASCGPAHGGVGLQINITGSSVYYAGGGGGVSGTGGQGGGGDYTVVATPNTGGGGGSFANGADGIVIVRYTI
tara:strand:+ start:384 stop:1241 length:858 start_codon:yes stop_codon:yes gene_type:complete